MTPDGNDLLCPIGSLSALAEIVRQTAHNSDSDAPCGLVSDAFEHCENASSTDVETQSDTCRTGNASGSGTAEKYGALSQAITDQIVQSLDSANEITERAVLAIGNQISSLFEIAKNNNEAAVSSLGEVLGRSASHSHAGEPTSQHSIVCSKNRRVFPSTDRTRRRVAVTGKKHGMQYLEDPGHRSWQQDPSNQRAD